MYRRSVDGRGIVLAAVVLAAGSGSRFSPHPGAKLLADLAGRPLLKHVLAEVRLFGPAATVVVLGHGAEVIEQALDWQGEIRVRNPRPSRGLASSLQVGIDTLRALPLDLGGAFIILGDQPRLRVDVLEALASAAESSRSADRAAVVPRYEDEGPRNPVLLLRPAWSWVDELDGDRGLAPSIASRPDAVLEVPVSGGMPDVDEATDLERLRGPVD
jgi:molybdenum cofactor cytidylyltransferase